MQGGLWGPNRHRVRSPEQHECHTWGSSRMKCLSLDFFQEGHLLFLEKTLQVYRMGWALRLLLIQTIPGFWDSVELRGEVPCSVCLAQAAQSMPHPSQLSPISPTGLGAAGCSCSWEFGNGDF